MIPPVSVCHQVSTIGHFSPPITRWYHIHASGLIGSPTVPSTRSDDRSWAAASSVPHFMNVRMAVGAVYSWVTPYRSMMSHSRSLGHDALSPVRNSGRGVSGVPSYITEVHPLASGP